MFCLALILSHAPLSSSLCSANPTSTRDIYVMDAHRDLFHYMQVFGHEDEVPVWSREIRWLVYVAR